MVALELNSGDVEERVVRKVLLGQWQAMGYLLVLAACLLYSALTAPYWDIPFAICAGLVLPAPLVLSQWCGLCNRKSQGYFFAVAGAIMYALICIVGASILIQALAHRLFLAPLSLLLLTSETGLAGAAAVHAADSALRLGTFHRPCKNMQVQPGRRRTLDRSLVPR